MKEPAAENHEPVSNVVSLSDRIAQRNTSLVDQKRNEMLEILRCIDDGDYSDDQCALIIRNRIPTASVLYEGGKIYAHAPGKPRVLVREFLKKVASDAIDLLDERGEAAIPQSPSSSE